MNYLKYKLNKVRQVTTSGAARVSDLRQMEDPQARVRQVRDRSIVADVATILVTPKLRTRL